MNTKAMGILCAFFTNRIPTGTPIQHRVTPNSKRGRQLNSHATVSNLVDKPKHSSTRQQQRELKKQHKQWLHHGFNNSYCALCLEEKLKNPAQGS